MNPQQAIALVEQQGIVLETARGPVPSLAEAVAGESIRGSWWGHPAAHAIHAITRAVRESPDVLVCRLVAGKVTLVHRRLWPALVRLAARLPAARLASVREIHTDRGHHEVVETPFPDWVPEDVTAEAAAMKEGEAEAALSGLLGGAGGLTV